MQPWECRRAKPFTARTCNNCGPQLAHPFSARELAWIIQTCYALAIDHRGIRRILTLHHLSPDVLRLHDATRPPDHLSPCSAGEQLPLEFEPTSLAQRLAQALGPDHLLLRFRTYREYPTEEQARWRIIELLEVGFRPRRIATLLAIDPHVVYYTYCISSHNSASVLSYQ
jgi:hypothetical protein